MAVEHTVVVHVEGQHREEGRRSWKKVAALAALAVVAGCALGVGLWVNAGDESKDEEASAKQGGAMLDPVGDKVGGFVWPWDVEEQVPKDDLSNSPLPSPTLSPTVESTKSPSSANATGDATTKAGKPPIVILAGLAAGEIQIRRDNSESRHWNCQNDHDWMTGWFNLANLIPGINMHCTLEALEPVYNPETGLWGNHPGVETRVSDFGGREASIGLNGARIYHTLVRRLEDLGWESRKNVHMAPFDWRFAPGTPALDEHFDKTKALIEETFQANGNKRVTLFGHSMGCLISLDFLNRLSVSWREKYIERYIGAGCPLGGSPALAQASASGWALGLPLASNLLRPVQANAPAGVYMYPTADLWDDDEVIVETPSKQYTVKNLSEMLQDLGLEHSQLAYQTLQKSSQIQGEFLPPLVDTYMFYADDRETDISVKYFWDFKPGEYNLDPISVRTEGGDGLVPLRSLLRFKKWKSAHQAAGKALHAQAFPCAEHISMVERKDLVELVANLLLGSEPCNNTDMDAYERGESCGQMKDSAFSCLMQFGRR